MSKKKRSKILATLLCATTMAAFYVSPQIGYAVDLYYKTDGSGEVVINGGGTNTKIEDLSGIASITFGTPGEQGEGGVRFFLDAQEFGGVRAEGAFTANDLYIMVDPKGEGTERYSLRNVMGIYRNQDQITGEYATSIESGISGGGMQITNDTINMLDGTIAISTENNAKYNISFDGKFNSEQGMTVGTDYTLDNRGNITTTGSISAKGTINGNEITENTFNEVTLDGGEVTADEVIADGYKLTEVGSTLKTIDDKTKGIISYTSADGGNTTFQGKITAYSGIVTSDVQTNTLNTTSIVSGSESFTVHEAKEAIDWVDEWGSKVSGYDGRITQNENDIDALEKTVGDEREGLVKDVSDLQTATTGMTYNQSTGTTFAQAVTANDFKIADGTSLSQVASELTTAQGNIQKNTNNITTLTGKVTTAESEIDVLQTTVGDENSGLVAKTKNLNADGSTLTGMTNITTNTFTATSGSIGSIGFSGNNLTNVASIGGVDNTVTVAGTAIGNGSFNGVTIADYNTNGSQGATINSVSIYQDSSNDYWVGNVNISDLTSGSGVTVGGIERSDNTLQDKEDNDYTTTIEGNLEVRTDGTITQRNGDFAVSADGTVTGKDFVIDDTNTTLSGVATDVSSLNQKTTGMTYTPAGSGTVAITSFDHEVQATNVTTTTGADLNELSATVGDANSGLVQNVNTLNTKTTNLSADGSTLTGMTNITTNTFTATSGSIGSIGFIGNNLTNVASIGGVDNTVTVAGTAISNGSFNGVNIGVDSNSHATFNGVSIYKDANDYIVGDVNISALKGVSGTEIKGIKRTSNTGGGFTTTIEENLAVSTDGTIKQTKGAFAVDAEGTVTGKDFVIDGTNTTLSGVATDVSSLNQKTTGMTYTPAGSGTVAVTSFDHEVQATNVTTTTGADLNELSATVGDANSGLVQNVNALNTKTTNLSADGSTLTDMTNIESAAGTIGGMTFATVNGMKTIGSADDTITVAGAEITSNSFNNVEIYQNDENSHYFVGDVDVSALQSGSAEITNKLRGITYSSDDPDDLNNYTMTFAEHFSVSTSGEFTFKDKNGAEYHLDDLINTVDVGDLDKIKDLAGRVDNLEDKTTGIEFNKETGETTISHMNGTDTDTDGVNDTFTKGDNFFAVNEDGISANGDTFVRGDGQTSGGGTGGGTGTNTSDHFVDGDQTVGGSQFVAGDGNFNGSVSVGAGEDVFIDSNGNDTLDDGEISLSGVNSKVEGISVKVDGIGDVSSVNENIAGDSDDDGTNDLAGAVNNEYQQRVEADNALNERINSIDNRMGELEDRIDKVGAMAAAIANLRTMGYDPAAPTEVAVGIGQYRNETGAALGLFHYPNRDFMLSLSVSTSGDEVMGGIGATWKFGRKSPEKVAAEKAEKAREAKLQKAEAIKEAARLKKIEAQQERHAKLAAQKTATK